MLTMFSNIMLWIMYIGDVKRNVARHVTHDVTPYLLTLANRNDPICVVSPKVAKASTTRVAVTSIIAGIIALTFANGNTALV
jgi:hypothetical protein